MTLQELLTTTVDMNGREGLPDFRIAVQSQSKKGVHIIVHPFGYDGHTLDLLVKGNKLTVKEES